MGRDKYPLTTRKWCRECSNPLKWIDGMLVYFYAGDYGPLCSEKCCKPFEEFTTALTATGRIKKPWSRTSNVRRIEVTKVKGR